MASVTIKGKERAFSISKTANKDIDSAWESGSSTSSGTSSGDSDNNSVSESEEEYSEQYLESLIEKAKQNARMKAATKSAFADDEEDMVIKLEADKPAKKLPELNPGHLPPTYIEPNEAGPSRIHDPDAERAQKASSSLSTPAPPAPPKASLTKKQRKELKNKTAGRDWFDLPAPAEADLPRLYREVEALRLRNQLDPKRFYRKDPGEGKGISGLPKHFAIGKIIETKSPFGGASGENLTRSSRKRTLVDELLDDAEARSHAKKKFRELQSVRGARGRGTLAKKLAARRQKW